MEVCENKKFINSRFSMKKEIIEDLKNYQNINEDTITEIADSLTPIYNSELIDFVAHYQGNEYWNLWNDNELDYTTPLDILRGNVYCLYLEIGYEVLNELEEE